MTGFVSVFPHYEGEEVPLQVAAAVCPRAPTHPVGPISPNPKKKKKSVVKCLLHI